MRLDGHACTLCGNPASATWSDDGAVYVCHQCAVHSLPALITDAVSLAADDPRDRAVSVWRQIEATYWRALALRLLNERGGSC
jgi:hypothetical protein